MGYCLSVNQLCKVVKNKHREKEILHNVNLEVNDGEFVAIIGCSGAGKTTLMNLLSGYSRISKGEIRVDGIDLKDNYGKLKGSIAYVPQREILHDTLTLKETLFYGMQLKIPNVTKEEMQKKLEELLKLLELEGKENTKIKYLSGGEKRRTAIAMELLSDPKLFLLDEPTSGLDSNIEKKIMQKLRELANLGKTIIMTAHTVSNLYMCDKVIVMGQNGKICYSGSYEGIFEYFHINDFIDVYDTIKNDTDIYYEKYCQTFVTKNTNEKELISSRKKVCFLKQMTVLTKVILISFITINHGFCYSC